MTCGIYSSVAEKNSTIDPRGTCTGTVLRRRYRYQVGKIKSTDTGNYYDRIDQYAAAAPDKVIYDS